MQEIKLTFSIIDTLYNPFVKRLLCHFQVHNRIAGKMMGMNALKFFDLG